MTPIDLRNATFHSLRDQLAARRAEVFTALCDYGPMTTRAAALRLAREVHAVRPRFTELHQMGLIELHPDSPAGEGLYRARTREEWEAWRAVRMAELGTSQQQLLPAA